MTDIPNKKNSSKTMNRVLAVAAGSLIAISTAFGVHAFSTSKTYQHMQLEGGMGGVMQARWGGRHHRGGWSNLSDEELENRITRMVKHAGIEIDATDEQEAKIVSLLTTAAKEVLPLREKMRETRKQVRDLMTAETIDRAALEQLRAERVTDMDAMSKKLVDTLADVAEVLTPEQRSQLEDRMEEFRGFRKGMRHGDGKRGWHHDGRDDDGPRRGRD